LDKPPAYREDWEEGSIENSLLEASPTVVERNLKKIAGLFGSTIFTAEGRENG